MAAAQFPLALGSAYLRVTSNTQNYVPWTVLGSPLYNASVYVEVAPGVTLGSANTGQSALTTGSLGGESIVHVINRGKILGCGGNGGPGGGGSGSNGLPGGNAILTTVKMVVNNTDGTIAAGAGGGAGAPIWPGHGGTSGGGGGGGAGSSPGSGGAGTDGRPAGSPGTETTGGAYGSSHCAGGFGGNQGQPGNGCGGCDAQPGASGGPAGKAISLGGGIGTATITGTGTILGAIS